MRLLPVLDRDGSLLSRTRATGKLATVRAVKAHPHSLRSGSLLWTRVVERRRRDSRQEQQTKPYVRAC
jgi:hypothetical protein